MGFKHANFQCPDSGVGVTVTNQGGWRAYVDDDRADVEEYAESVTAAEAWCKRANGVLRYLHAREDVENVLVDRFGCEADDLDSLTW